MSLPLGAPFLHPERSAPKPHCSSLRVIESIQYHHKEMRKGVLCKIAPPPSPRVPRPYFNLEPQLDSGLEAKVVLAVVAAGEVVAEAGQLIIRVHQPDRDLAADGDIHATADRHGKGIVAWRLAAACSGVLVAGIGAKVGVDTT
jgi:hypothetical protein